LFIYTGAIDSGIVKKRSISNTFFSRYVLVILNIQAFSCNKPNLGQLYLLEWFHNNNELRRYRPVIHPNWKKYSKYHGKQNENRFI